MGCLVVRGLFAIRNVNLQSSTIGYMGVGSLFLVRYLAIMAGWIIFPGYPSEVLAAMLTSGAWPVNIDLTSQHPIYGSPNPVK